MQAALDSEVHALKAAARQEAASCKAALDEVHSSLAAAQQGASSQQEALKAQLTSASDKAVSQAKADAAKQLEALKVSLTTEAEAAKKQAAAQLSQAQAKTKALETQVKELKAALEAKVRGKRLGDGIASVAEGVADEFMESCPSPRSGSGSFLPSNDHSHKSVSLRARPPLLRKSQSSSLPSGRALLSNSELWPPNSLSSTRCGAGH